MKVEWFRILLDSIKDFLLTSLFCALLYWWIPFALAHQLYLPIKVPVLHSFTFTLRYFLDFSTSLSFTMPHPSYIIHASSMYLIFDPDIWQPIFRTTFLNLSSINKVVSFLFDNITDHLQTTAQLLEHIHTSIFCLVFLVLYTSCICNL